MHFKFNNQKTTLPLASLHGEHSVKTADVMIGIGALYSSCPVIRIPVYATAMDEFGMPRVQIEMLNEICRDHSHLQSIRFPTIRDNRIGILIGADAFTATVLRQFTTGPTGTPYGVNTLLGWTLTGPIPQRYTQKRVGQSNSTNITLFNHIKRRQDDPDEDLLQLFWTIEGVNFNQCSSKGQSSDDKEAVSILNDTIRHIGDRYQIGLPWKKDITLPNNYFMAKVHWHALQQRLERDTNLRDRCEETIKKDLDKNYITTADPSCRHSVWYLPHHPVINKQKPDKISRVTNAASKYKGLSLNDALLTGPDLLCNLHGLLLRFRQYSVAITVDIGQCSRRLASNQKTKTISVFSGQRMAMKKSSNTIDSFLEPHAHLLVRYLFCRSVQMTTNKNIQRPTHQSCSSSTWMISCRPTLLKRRPAEVQRRSKLFYIQEDSI